jgi:hypothetical protein
MRILYCLLTFAFVAAAAAEDSSCQLNVSGDLNKSFRYEVKSRDPLARGKVGATTDYWMWRPN